MVDNEATRRLFNAGYKNDRDMSKKICASFVLVLLLARQVSATVVVVIVTRSAIVIGADGKGVSGTPDSILAGTGISGMEDKVVLLNETVLVANVGVSRISLPDGRVLYDFQAWLASLFPKARGGDAPTVSQVARRIQNSSFAIFDKAVSSTLKTGKFTSLNLAHDSTLPIITYFIAGYEGKKVKVFEVYIDVDWQKRTLKKPIMKPLYPPPPSEAKMNLQFASNGASGRGISMLRTKDSPIQKAYLAKYPKEIGALVYDQPLDCAGAVSLARIALSVEISASPDIFGFPISVFALPCKPSRYRYDN